MRLAGAADRPVSGNAGGGDDGDGGGSSGSRAVHSIKIELGCLASRLRADTGPLGSAKEVRSVPLAAPASADGLSRVASERMPKKVPLAQSFAQPAADKCEPSASTAGSTRSGGPFAV
jgi:hypothetical protein